MVGRRNTIQRELVLAAVRELGCHATAEEVYSKVSEAYSSISKGTVYRNLRILSDDGSIRKVEIPGAADHYDHIVEKHHHICCVKCGRIFDIEIEDIPDIEGRIKNKHGFSCINYDIVFKGICPGCK